MPENPSHNAETPFCRAIFLLNPMKKPLVRQCLAIGPIQETTALTAKNPYYDRQNDGQCD